MLFPVPGLLRGYLVAVLFVVPGLLRGYLVAVLFPVPGLLRGYLVVKGAINEGIPAVDAEAFVLDGDAAGGAPEFRQGGHRRASMQGR